MDIILPCLNGIELVDSLLNERWEIPIIINTAFSGYKNDFVAWKADAYIIKSSDLSKLKNKSWKKLL